MDNPSFIEQEGANESQPPPYDQSQPMATFQMPPNVYYIIYQSCSSSTSPQATHMESTVILSQPPQNSQCLIEPSQMLQGNPNEVKKYSWKAALALNLIGLVCGITLLAIVGLILCCFGESSNNQKILIWAHYLGITSIICGTLQFAALWFIYHTFYSWYAI